MREAREELIEAINAKRQQRLIKWVDVAQALRISAGHLRKIRNDETSITSDVAAAIDLFLERPHGTSWAQLNRDAAPAPALRAEPADDVTDEKLAEMSNREIAEMAIRYQNERGPDARRELLQRAKAARDNALDTLVAESAESSS